MIWKKQPVGSKLEALNSKIALVPNYSTCTNMFNNSPEGFSTGYVGANTSDAPTTSSGMVMQYKYSGSYGWQMIASTRSNGIYFRRKNNGTWTSWYSVDNSTAVYTKGTYSNDVQFGVSGYVTDSKKKAEINIPMMVDQTVTSISITSLVVRLRLGNGGYLGGVNNMDLTSKIVSATVNKEQGILVVQLEDTNDFGSVNNVCFAGEVTISFTLS